MTREEFENKQIDMVNDLINLNNEIENNDNNKSKNYHIDDSKIVIDVKNNFILFGI